MRTTACRTTERRVPTAEQLDLPPMTFEEYLAHEVNARVKHEIRDGILVAMAGGSPEHSDVAGNVLTELMNAYREGNPCRPSGSDQMVYLPGPDTGAYPDVSAVCASGSSART